MDYPTFPHDENARPCYHKDGIELMDDKHLIQVCLSEGMCDHPDETMDEISKVMEIIKTRPHTSSFSIYFGSNANFYPNYGSIHFFQNEGETWLNIHVTNTEFSFTTKMDYVPVNLWVFLSHIYNMVMEYKTMGKNAPKRLVKVHAIKGLMSVDMLEK